MKREQMEHVLRAAAAITGEQDFVVIGSQALLASVPDLPPPLNQSMEIDLYPLSNPSAADLIEGTIGEMSPFDATFGYYAHGVSSSTSVLPLGWRDRTVTVQNENTGGARAICLGPLDLAVAKLAAGREKDFAFVQEMLRLQIVTAEDLLSLLLELDEASRALVRERMGRLES